LIKEEEFNQIAHKIKFFVVNKEQKITPNVQIMMLFGDLRSAY